MRVGMLPAAALIVGLAVGAPQTQAAPTYSIINVGTLAASETSYGLAINNNGEVAGYSFGPAVTQGFIYRNGVIQPLPAPMPGLAFAAYAINNLGQVAGFYRAPGDVARAFSSDGVNSSDLGSLQPGRESVAWGMNDLGQVVGYTSYLSGGGSGQVAVIYQNGQVTQVVPGATPLYGTAHDINNRGQIAGVANTGPGGSAIAGYYENGSFTSIGSLGGRSEAHAINELGFIVGVSNLDADAKNGQHAFYWNGSMRDIGVLGGDCSFATALNDLNQVVGWSSSAGGISCASTRAFIWDESAGLRDLNDLIPPDSGWTLTSAHGINGRGWITGIGTLAGVGERPFLLVPQSPPGTAPEPGTLALLGLGLAGLAASRRRSRAS